MPTKRTIPTAAPAAKPTTLNTAEEAGRLAHAEVVGDTEPTAPTEQSTAVPPAARTRMELLRVVTFSNHSEIEKEAFRREFTDLITNAISEMGELRLQEVAQFIDILEHDRGCCSTPAEQFIGSMVRSHYMYGGLTPDMVAEEVDPDNEEGFYENFKCLSDERRHFDVIYGNRRPDVGTQKETT